MKPIELIKQNAEALYGEEQLLEKLATGKRLKVKLGVDPTRPDLTFGHMVVFNKLRQFQDLGHEAILIIGDFTTLIGDPSGRSSTRPVLTEEEIKANAETYVNQAYNILDPDKTTVRFNSEWFNDMSFKDCLGLARKMTVARMLERDDFSKRFGSNTPISIIEFLYPLVQGYDSVMIEADVELGGTDQTFNCLVGRQLQKEAGQSEQAVLTLPLLVGTDGTKKMSKSQDNYIAFNDSPKEMFGKIMSISDEVMWDYYHLLLLKADEEVKVLKEQHPMELKKQLASILTSMIHGEGVGEHERGQFEQVFSQNKRPDEMPAFNWDELADEESQSLLNLLGNSKLIQSKKEARRLIQQGSVKVNDVKETDPFSMLSRPDDPMVIQAGKRIFLEIRP
ncbi:tyrosine--tRNA ligase [Puniceicoccales bacterium CK1056]|uniref:Tyrosine--tRNA ligase n=1 Tax=Oceanipulchritudo coccoides TaxID=2706888 RepID=A0A6B2LZL3_9BACT|nr:tyrosine--tRNA ligase [Oceanipulchritudo coccoides]NDV61506.1 tyrosine--tRNA ligase [Oceanipulchritudo coccoides]